MEKEKYLPGYTQRREHLFKSANALMIITLLFNMVKGFISVSLGFLNSSVTLFAFGIDSFVELVYWIAVWNMIQRSSEGSFADINDFEKKILKITGPIFYVLSIGIAIVAIINIIRGHSPDSMFSGITMALISGGALFALFFYKSRLGEKLNSDVITADAEYTKLSIYLSIILLISSLCYELFRIGIFDLLGAIFLGVLIFMKGRAALQKAQSKNIIENQQD